MSFQHKRSHTKQTTRTHIYEMGIVEWRARKKWPGRAATSDLDCSTGIQYLHGAELITRHVVGCHDRHRPIRATTSRRMPRLSFFM